MKIYYQLKPETIKQYNSFFNYNFEELQTGIFVKEYVLHYHIECAMLSIDGTNYSFRKSELIKL